MTADTAPTQLGRLLLLGVPRLAQDAAPRILECERRTQLLGYLAARGGWVGRAEAASLLWPEQDRKLALTNLRKALHRLQVDDLASLIEAEGGALRVAIPSDLDSFHQALTTADHASALALWQGEFLAGFDDLDNPAWTSWLDFERGKLKAAWRAALRRYLEQLDEPFQAVELALRLHEDDPLDEDALRIALGWLARAGQAARMQQVYLQFCQRLREEMGLEPGADLISFVASLRQPAGTPLQAGEDQTRADALVGRVAELRRITGLLQQSDCRLLCLTGTGGIGKTRLARELARQLGGSFADGVHFVQLEDLSSAADVPGRLARELRLKLRPGVPTLTQLAEHLKDRRCLIILDNFESVLAAAPLLVQMLGDCASLQWLVTSRVRLGLADEWLVPLDGLPCPDPEDREEFDHFDAPRLFIRAARRVRPDFDPRDEADALIDICQRVAGLPLALELAAAWTPVLSCAEIARELRTGPDLLNASDSEHPSRHASMDRVFDSSWNLLNPLERETLARLSAFAGNFSVDAARVVAGARLPILRTLADKSLLRREGERLSLHPLVQQLSAVRLAAGGWQAATDAAHAAYFHAMLHRLRPGSAGINAEALAAIGTDFANIRLAWRYAVLRGDGGALLRSLPALVSYFEDRARFSDGIELLDLVLAEPGLQADAACIGGVLAQRAQLLFRLSRATDAVADASRALEQLGEQGPEDMRYRATSVLGACAMTQGRPADAIVHYGQALEHCRALGDRNGEAATLENISLAEKYLGHYEVALARTMEALALHRRNGDVARTALSLSNLASFQVFLGNLDLGREHLQEALELAEKNNLVSTRAFALANLVELSVKSGEFDAAEDYARQAMPVAEETGLRSLACWLLAQRSRLASLRGDLSAARKLLRDAADLVMSVGAPTMKAEVLGALAECVLAAGHAVGARRILHFGSAEPLLLAPNRKELAEALRKCGGDPDAPPAWPDLSLDELLRRVVVESEAGFGALIASIEAA